MANARIRPDAKNELSRSLLQTGIAMLWVVVLLAGGVTGALARLEGDRESDPRVVFEAIAAAWSVGDADALAELVQTDGLRVTLGGSGDRATEYSPSQALYYFKNLFQTKATDEFRFLRMQDVRDGGRAHGMAFWRFRPSGPTQGEELRLVFLLTRQDDVWRLSEINKITVR